MYLIIREWLERFIELMLPSATVIDNIRMFIIARHLATMVALLALANSLIIFQVVNGYLDYNNLKKDYTQLNVAYLRNGDTYELLNQRMSSLERVTTSLYADNQTLVGKVIILYQDNQQLRVQLEQCPKPKDR